MIKPFELCATYTLEVVGHAAGPLAALLMAFQMSKPFLALLKRGGGRKTMHICTLFAFDVFLFFVIEKRG